MLSWSFLDDWIFYVDLRTEWESLLGFLSSEPGWMAISITWFYSISYDLESLSTSSTVLSKLSRWRIKSCSSWLIGPFLLVFTAISREYWVPPLFTSCCLKKGLAVEPLCSTVIDGFCFLIKDSFTALTVFVSIWESLNRLIVWESLDVCITPSLFQAPICLSTILGSVLFSHIIGSSATSLALASVSASLALASVYASLALGSFPLFN